MQAEIKLASVEDQKSIWDLIKSAYKDFSHHILPDRWLWQYVDNPHINMKDNSLPVLLATVNGTAVGQACVIFNKIKVDDQIHTVTWGADFIVMPECRGMGLGKKLMKVEIEHFKFMMGSHMPPATRNIAAQLGYKTLDAAYVYYRPVKFSRPFISDFLFNFAKKFIKSKELRRSLCQNFITVSLITAVINRLTAIRDIYEKLKIKKTSTVMSQVDEFDKRIDELWETTNHQYKIIVKRDSEHLNWRYSSKSGLNYKKFIALRDGAIKGYVILRKAEAGEINFGKIVDIYASREDRKTIRDLIRYSINYFGRDVLMIDCMSSIKEYAEVLRKNGFYRAETVIPMYFCEDINIAAKLKEFKSNCFFTSGDHDRDQYTPYHSI